VTTPLSLAAWAARWNLPPMALAELRQLTGAQAVDPEAQGFKATEGWAQSAVRLEAARAGAHLWRNNVGALADERGRFVRFGLANDSAGLNAVLKSSDLIGIKPRVIGPQDVGYLVGQFFAREIKEPGWTYKGTPREEAQANFINLVNSHGGDAGFATGPGSF